MLEFLSTAGDTGEERASATGNDETAYQLSARSRSRGHEWEAVGTAVQMVRVDGFHYNDQIMNIENDADAIYASVNVAAYTNSYTDMQLSGTPLGVQLVSRVSFTVD